MLYFIFCFVDFAADHFYVNCVPCVTTLRICKSVNFVVFRVNLELESFYLLFEIVLHLFIFVFLVEVRNYQIFYCLDQLFGILLVFIFLIVGGNRP